MYKHGTRVIIVKRDFGTNWKLHNEYRVVSKEQAIKYWGDNDDAYDDLNNDDMVWLVEVDEPDDAKPYCILKGWIKPVLKEVKINGEIYV
jgi:hypothetical protein